MTESIKTIAKKCVRQAVRPLLRMAGKSRDVVVHMEGGICSQMHYYLVGELMRRRGFDVRFDVSWYDTNGRDMDGVFVRNLNLLKLFPDLTLRTCDSPSRTIRCSTVRENDWNDRVNALAWTEAEPPLYMTGYYHDPEVLFTEYFHECFHPDISILSDQSKLILDEIERAGENAVAIHVRLGDLKREHMGYGLPASVKYFEQAVNMMLTQHPDARFFLFSDEPEWCRSVLLPQLPANEKFRIAEANGSDRGYEDLLLISRCPMIISSKGTFGKYAALLRPAELRHGLVTICADSADDEDALEWQGRIPNSKVIIQK